MKVHKYKGVRYPRLVSLSDALPEDFRSKWVKLEQHRPSGNHGGRASYFLYFSKDGRHKSINSLHKALQLHGSINSYIKHKPTPPRHTGCTGREVQIEPGMPAGWKKVQNVKRNIKNK